MKIKIDRTYTGPGGITRLPPGVYEADDERLAGRAEYLLSNRIAVVVREPKSADKPPGKDDGKDKA